MKTIEKLEGKHLLILGVTVVLVFAFLSGSGTIIPPINPTTTTTTLGTCTDTDNGSFYVAGCTTFNGVTECDVCGHGNFPTHLYESACSGGQLVHYLYPCSTENKNCVNGACV
jgi:hypothetical protein